MKKLWYRFKIWRLHNRLWDLDMDRMCGLITPCEYRQSYDYFCNEIEELTNKMEDY